MDIGFKEFSLGRFKTARSSCRVHGFRFRISGSRIIARLMASQPLLQPRLSPEASMPSCTKETAQAELLG